LETLINSTPFLLYFGDTHLLKNIRASEKYSGKFGSTPNYLCLLRLWFATIIFQL